MNEQTDWEKEFDDKFCYDIKIPSSHYGSRCYEKDSYMATNLKSFLDHQITKALEEQRLRIREEIEEIGDIWKLEKEGKDTESGCPKFERINRQILSLPSLNSISSKEEPK